MEFITTDTQMDGCRLSKIAVMAFSGGGDARSMAGGGSKATLPTMAGMTTALSGVFATIYLNSAKSREEERIKELIKN